MELNLYVVGDELRRVMNEAVGSLSVDQFLYVLRRSSMDAGNEQSAIGYYDFEKGDVTEWFDFLVVMKDSDWRQYCIVDGGVASRILINKSFFDCVVRLVSFLLDYLSAINKFSSSKWGDKYHEKKYVPSWKRSSGSSGDLEYTP